MLKNCLPSIDEEKDVDDYYRKRNIRRIYLSMILEYDAMVGKYIKAVKEAG